LIDRQIRCMLGECHNISLSPGPESVTSKGGSTSMHEFDGSSDLD
jgi:hypothetical protein